MCADNNGDRPTYHYATDNEETKEYHLLAHKIISKVTQRKETEILNVVDNKTKKRIKYISVELYIVITFSRVVRIS